MTDILDDEEFGLGSLGPADGSLFSDADALIDRTMGDVELGQPVPLHGVKAREELEQPVNQATMCCLRGPCEHFWVMTARFPSGDGQLHRQQIRTCLRAPQEETPLSEQNVYQCDQWWPAAGVLIPETLRPMLRPRLVAVWERFLALRGYDFTWRQTDGVPWGPHDFEGDDVESRKVGVISNKPPAAVFGRGATMPDTK